MRVCLVCFAILAVPAAVADTALDEISELMAGKFDTHVLQPELAAEERLVDERTRIVAPQIGDYVLYQQLNHRENLEVYRQRILVLAPGENDVVEQRAYALNEPQWYVDAEPASFQSLSMDDLDAFMPDGCEQLWTRTKTGFKGYVDPKRCVIISSRTGKPRQIESENLLTRETLSLAERGFDPESGEQLFGTAPGEYLELGRVETP